MFCPKCNMLKSNCICDIKEKSRKSKKDIPGKSGITIKRSALKSKKKNYSKSVKKTSDGNEHTKQNLDYESVEEQSKIISEIDEAINDGYKYIILESGAGNQTIAVKLAEKYESSFILSANERLQNRYINHYKLKNNSRFHVSNHRDMFDEFKNYYKRKLLIVDDAHRLDENIVSLFSYSIDLSIYEDSLLDNFECKVNELEDKDYTVWLRFIDYLSLDDENIKRMVKYIKENPENWICSYNSFQYEKINFYPLDIGDFAKKYWFDNAEICIFLSSTIVSLEIFCNELGLDVSQVKFIHKEYPFDSDKNQIYLRDSVNMKFDENARLLIPIINGILEKHKNERGVIHTDKRKYTDFIRRKIDSSRLIIHSNGDYYKRPGEFKISSDSVIVSDSMAEGVNFPYDQCRFQIVVKEHLDPWTSRAKYKEKESNLYSFKKVVNLLQILQTATKSKDDYCMNYILDENIFKTVTKDITETNFIPENVLNLIADMDIKNQGLISDNIKKKFGVYYLFDYIVDGRDVENLDLLSFELSIKIISYKKYSIENPLLYVEEFNYFTKKMMEAVSELSNQVIGEKFDKLALICVPSSTAERDQFASVRASINCIQNWYDSGKAESDFGCKKEIINCSNLLIRADDVNPSHLTKNRPSYGQHMNSIECADDDILEDDDVAFIILDDISTRGTVMNACEDILIDKGVNEDNIYKFALFKTLW